MTREHDPIQSLAVAPNGDVAKMVVQHVGLTKREYFAAIAMQGLCAYPKDLESDHIASHAVTLADMLIDALNTIR